ncbi:hypothetical protein [Hymenobacter metallicola]|uniref:DUF2490 domain-containing protein n=1 Tax=Hymenobacter metallicola TaxID=2563114 RepID=A0A4Z0QAK1_9BACT|nr:hypothetical protein [Hymenobacter metallicola]TGE27097.1 hypothetical protein E5K02_11890 [Hymenobacter metallicola]
MRYFRWFTLGSCVLFCGGAATAQRRSVSDLTLAPEVQVEVALAGDDYLFVGYHSLLLPNQSGLDGGQIRAGYEHFWNENWSGGATLRFLGSSREGLGDFLGQPGFVLPGLLLRHRSSLGKFTLGQRLGAEYGIGSNTRNSQGQAEARSLVRLRLDVERMLPLGATVALRPRLAYEPAAYLRLQRDDEETKERVLDFGALRAEVGVRVGAHVEVTPWVATQTRYLNTLAQFDADGNQTGGGRTNLVTPLVGLDVRFTVLPMSSTERRQLPTQH